MENKVDQEGTFLYAFIHHSTAQYHGQSLYVITNGNGGKKGCEVLFGEHHRAGPVRPAIQVVQNTNFAPGTRALAGGDFESAPTFASSVSNSYMAVFPHNFTDKGYKKSIYGHNTRARPTTKDFARLD